MMTKIEMQAMDAVIGIHREMRKMNEPDWEKRRYEIAKEVLPHISISYDTDFNMRADVRKAVQYADALIEELKKGSRLCD